MSLLYDPHELGRSPGLPFSRWNVVQRPADPTAEILAQAEEPPADVIYMSTNWSRVRFGRTENTVTERVIGAGLCPVATVPVS